MRENEQQTRHAVRTREPAASRMLLEAQQALTEGRWAQASHRFEAAVTTEETPEALEGLGAASWWLEDVPTVLASRERAYRLFRERGDHIGAGRVAVELGFDYAVFKAEMAVSNGWFLRAHRWLDDLDPVPEQVWLVLREAELAYHTASDMERTRRLAVDAKELAVRLGVLDLELMGLALEGLAMVGMGKVPEGMRRLDEATAAAVAGDMQDLKSVAATCCFMIFACERVGDVDRASQWCDQFMEFCRRMDMQPYLAFCRAHHASVLIARGRWNEAEDLLIRSRQELRARIAWSMTVHERLGELRRRQGRLEEADESFARAYPRPGGVLGAARVALNRSKLDVALDLAEGMLRRLPERDRVERVATLELLAWIRCASGDVAGAEKAVGELEAVAKIVGADGLVALARHVRGHVALAAADAEAATNYLQDALDLYERVRLPFEVAIVRMDRSRALRALGRTEAAVEQARRASDSLRSLGAELEAGRAEAVVRELRGTEAPTHGTGGLSPRETEVLKLLSRGLSNQEIADELVLSRHTVRRHISNILTKLAVPSRTAAVAYALERKLV